MSRVHGTARSRRWKSRSSMPTSRHFGGGTTAASASRRRTRVGRGTITTTPWWCLGPARAEPAMPHAGAIVVLVAQHPPSTACRPAAVPRRRRSAAGVRGEQEVAPCVEHPVATALVTPSALLDEQPVGLDGVDGHRDLGGGGRVEVAKEFAEVAKVAASGVGWCRAWRSASPARPRRWRFPHRPPAPRHGVGHRHRAPGRHPGRRGHARSPTHRHHPGTPPHRTSTTTVTATGRGSTHERRTPRRQRQGSATCPVLTHAPLVTPSPGLSGRWQAKITTTGRRVVRTASRRGASAPPSHPGPAGVLHAHVRPIPRRGHHGCRRARARRVGTIVARHHVPGLGAARLASSASLAVGIAAPTRELAT